MALGQHQPHRYLLPADNRSVWANSRLTSDAADTTTSTQFKTTVSKPGGLTVDTALIPPDAVSLIDRLGRARYLCDVGHSISNIFQFNFGAKIMVSLKIPIKLAQA